MNWKKVKLCEVADFIRGVTFKPSDIISLDSDDAVGCMRTKNVQVEIDLSDVWGLPARFVKRQEQYLQEGDLLVSTANSWNLVGKCSWVPHLPYPATAGGFISILRAGACVNRRFLFHWFSTPNTQGNLRNCGRQTTNISNMDLGRAEALEIPLPPLDEQQRIASILDHAHNLRRLRRQALEHLDELTQSLFLELFGDPATNPQGWQMSRIGDWSTKFSDGPFGSNLKSSHYVEAGIRVIRLQNIGVGELVDKDKAFISAEHYAKLPKNHCAPGDVLIGTLGDPNLRACILPPSIPEALNKADCVQMRVDESKASPRYVMALLNQPSVEKMAMGDIQGQTRLRISMGRLREIKFPLPPLSLQQTFAAQIEELEVLKTRARTQLLELDALFASLQERAFSGQL